MLNRVYSLILMTIAYSLQSLQAYIPLDGQIPLNYYSPYDFCDPCNPYTLWGPEISNEPCDLPCECSCWADVQYLHWQHKKAPKIVPLVFTGIFDSNVTPTLKTAGTRIVLGGRSIEDNGKSGIKATIGFNLWGDPTYSTDASYTYVGRKTTTNSIQSNDFPNGSVNLLPNSYLAIPFFDVSTGKESSVYLAKPGSFVGKAKLKVENWMQGFDWNIKMLLDSFDCNFQMHGLLGFRFWNFNDKLKFTTQSPNSTIPDIFTTVDQFTTYNMFYGGQIGFDARYTYNHFFCSASVKVALGGMNEKLKIIGDLFTNDFNALGPVQEYVGGYFAQMSNIGNYSKTKFAYIPEVNLNCGYQICENLDFNFGYTFLYVSKIFWAEDQIDSNINSTQSVAITGSDSTTFSGVPSPRALLKSKDFWIHGVNVGLQYRF